MSVQPEVQTPNVFQRLLAIMRELSYIQKGSKTMNGQYRYVSHDQVTAAIHPLLVKHGLVSIPTVMTNQQEGNRTTVQLRVHFINCDNPNDSFHVDSFGYGVDTGDKGPGKAISYAFKMACLKVFCLETGEDSDNDAEAVYEPAKCLDFDSMIPLEYTPKNRKELSAFIDEIAKTTNKHAEDIKREAMKRPAEFLKAFETKKKDK